MRAGALICEERLCSRLTAGDADGVPAPAPAR